MLPRVRPPMNRIASDFVCASRQVVRHRSFSVIVIVTLALGIGATTTFFSLLNALVFKPLSFPDPGRLVSVQSYGRPQAAAGDAYRSVIDVARNSKVVKSAVAYESRSVNATGAEGSERALSTAVSGDLFALLGTPFTHGRSFRTDEHRSHAAVAVISHT